MEKKKKRTVRMCEAQDLRAAVVPISLLYPLLQGNPLTVSFGVLALRWDQ